jgi:hypothetical protein
MTNVFRINHGLKKKALSAFYMTTLKEMFQEGIHTIAEEDVDYNVLNLIEDVGIYKYGGAGNNQRIWCIKAQRKLEVFEFTTVKQMPEQMFLKIPNWRKQG